MSMYWSGYEVLGCVIMRENLEYFKEKYLQYCIENTSDFNDMEREEQMELLNEWIVYNDCYKLDVIYINEEQFEGVNMQPLDNSWVEIYEGDMPFIIVAAEKQPYTRGILKNGFYANSNEIIAEFKDKIGKFLPPNFDFAANIGDVSYACFA